MIELLFGTLLLLQPQLPVTVNLCIAPDTSMGYFVQLDAGAPVDIGMPATKSCKDFIGGAIAIGVPFSVSVPTVGTHNVSVVGYTLGGSSPATSITFPVSAAPGPPGVRIVK